MLLMDGEKKRKRSENGHVNGGGDPIKHEVETAEKEDETMVFPPPTEAEVDEFFAILKRMHVAVKYLKRNAQTRPVNVDDHGNKLTASPTGAAGQERALGKGGLDLNTLPDDGD